MVLLRLGKADRKKGRKRVGVRRGSQLQLCLKQAGGTGTLNDVCDNGWMDVSDENYQCYDTKVMIRSQF